MISVINNFLGLIYCKTSFLAMFVMNFTCALKGVALDFLSYDLTWWRVIETHPKFWCSLDMDCYEQMFFITHHVYLALHKFVLYSILDTFEVKVIHSQVDWSSTSFIAIAFASWLCGTPMFLFHLSKLDFSSSFPKIRNWMPCWWSLVVSSSGIFNLAIH
jgi:hypothetical protein